ncbi:MAG: PTS sugar transporter subunit IIA [Acidobacteria bacterium]|nr:PTS sugar transporter subunit IIA [Acidobacteriota bacterium]
MSLSQLLKEDLIFLDLHPEDMPDCLRIMVQRAAEQGAISDPEDALERLLVRERTMSTGMGGGVAVPHAKSQRCRSMVVTLARVEDGVDFKAIDGKPVTVVFLLLGPPDSTRDHVDLLASIAHLVKKPGFLSTLHSAEHPRQILHAIREAQHQRQV